jgi:hypothetical protein
MTNPADDHAVQRAVLAHVLALHPTRLSADELRREILLGATSFAATDAYDRAVRDLIAVGLLRRDGDSIVPSRAALCFDVLGC